MATSYEQPWHEEAFELKRRHAVDPEADAVIVRDVRAMLAGTAGVEARNLVVEVYDGEVTLSGRLTERWMQLEIEHQCLQIEGVRDVVSHLHAPRDHSAP